MVDDGKEVMRLMDHKVRHCHFAAGDKSRQLSQQTLS